MFDLLFTQVNHKEIEYLLSDVKEKFIQNLYDLIQAYESKDNDNSDNQDNTIMVIKLLGKMGHLPRTIKYKIKVDLKENLDQDYFCFLFNKKQTDKKIKINLSEAVNSIYYFIKSIVDKKQNIPKTAFIDNSYKFLKNILVKIFRINDEMFEMDYDYFVQHSEHFKTRLSMKQQKHSSYSFEMSNFIISEDDLNFESFSIKKTVIEKIVYCLINFLVLSNIYSNNCKQEIEETFMVLSKIVITNYILSKENGKEISHSDKNYLLLKSLIKNMSYRVLLIRGEPNYENLSEPYNFSIKLVESMLKYFYELSQRFPNEISEETYHSFINLLLELVISLSYQKKINKSFAGLMALERMMVLIPNIIIYEFSFKILGLIFAFLRELTDVIDIENKVICFNIGNKVMDNIEECLKGNPQKVFNMNSFLKLCVSHLISMKEIINKAAIHFFVRLTKIVNISPTYLLYYSTDSLAKKTDLSHKVYKKQMNFSIRELIEKYNNLYISLILQKCVQVLDININEEEIDKYKAIEANKLKLFSTALKTLEFLMSLDIIPFRMIVEDSTAMTDGEERLVFDLDFHNLMLMNWKLININEKIFRNASDIIISNPQPTNMQFMPNNAPATLETEERKSETTQGSSQTGGIQLERSSSIPIQSVNTQSLSYQLAQQAQNKYHI